MNENDKILINAYLDGETSEDESKYIESLLKSNNEANEFANNIKRANTDIDTYFNSSEFNDLTTNIDTFIKNQTKKSSKFSYRFDNFFTNPRYFGFAASAFLLIILVPTFNENKPDNSSYSMSPNDASFLEEIMESTSNLLIDTDNLPIYSISPEFSERDGTGLIDFNEIFNTAVLDYGDKSIWTFKIQADESTLIVQIDELKNNCYKGTVTRLIEERTEFKEFQVCKE